MFQDRDHNAPEPWQPQDEANPKLSMIDAGKSYLAYLKAWVVENVAVNWDSVGDPVAMECLGRMETFLQKNPTSELEDHFMQGIILLSRTTPSTNPTLIEMLLDGLEETANQLVGQYQSEHIIQSVRSVEAITT